jgi:tRNA pseudouridine55 synthase
MDQTKNFDDIVLRSDIYLNTENAIQLLSRDDGAIIFIDKPYGYTSHSVVHTLRRIITMVTGKKWVKVGHAGTLDPLATGLLILASGKKTKVISNYMGMPKKYEIELRLGITSPSYDLETPIQIIDTKTIPTDSEIRLALESFVGTSQQSPPLYSAVKHQGKPLYKHARKGKFIEVAPRMITVSKIESITISYPYVKFTAEVSKGTYIRSLVNDIGTKLQVGAILTNLRRTHIGLYSVSDGASLSLLHNIRQDLLTHELSSK